MSPEAIQVIGVSAMVTPHTLVSRALSPNAPARADSALPRVRQFEPDVLMDLAAERDVRPKLSAAAQPGRAKGTLVQLGESTIRIPCGKCNECPLDNS